MGIERHVYLVYSYSLQAADETDYLLLFYRKTININMFGFFHNKFNLHLPIFQRAVSSEHLTPYLLCIYLFFRKNVRLLL